MSRTDSQVAEAVGQQRGSAHIMVVDDDPIFRNVTRTYLEAIGHTVVEAADGVEGLKALNSSVPDVVLCDLAMPLLNGIEFVEEVGLEYPDLPLIVISATGDMSDIAKALRFGVKDFLSKPIRDYQHLEHSIGKVLDDNSMDVGEKDFIDRWFRLGEMESDDEKELQWHLKFLEENPNAARELLNALLPEKDSRQGVWHCSYRLLQSADCMPLVFDYTWLMSGQLAFYLVDPSSSESGGIASTLLVRALFDDYVRRLHHNVVDLKQLADNVEKGLNCSSYARSVEAIFGVADLTEGTLSILPAGLNCRWESNDANYNISGAKRLGEGCIGNFMTKELSIDEDSKLTLSKVGTTNFCWDIKSGRLNQ
ncbi:response regulator [Vibrio sp. ZSDZ34]|uniref:Response regulator n=1 Tax=Vibrio gelatinilyticus TaxID=2893468 RepID=A0A9X1WEG9_9VIBR|nr:response regulator [Vibrio gelatinilyticus]MCJ2375479.1 response regulator [Vibrio gelatinilyticus]